MPGLGSSRRAGAMSVTRAQASVAGVCFLNGAVFTSWYARLPSIQQRLDLDPGELGIALLGALDRLAGRPAARRGRGGSSRVADSGRRSAALPAGGDPPRHRRRPPHAPARRAGGRGGERSPRYRDEHSGPRRRARGGPRLFSSLHAAFSFGALAGASLAAVAVAARATPLPHLAASALVGAVVATALSPGLLRDGSGPGSRRGLHGRLCRLPGRIARDWPARGRDEPSLRTRSRVLALPCRRGTGGTRGERGAGSLVGAARSRWTIASASVCPGHARLKSRRSPAKPTRRARTMPDGGRHP